MVEGEDLVVRGDNWGMGMIVGTGRNGGGYGGVVGVKCGEVGKFFLWWRRGRGEGEWEVPEVPKCAKRGYGTRSFLCEWQEAVVRGHYCCG